MAVCFVGPRLKQQQQMVQVKNPSALLTPSGEHTLVKHLQTGAQMAGA
jgi:hypothetical protein